MYNKCTVNEIQDLLAEICFKELRKIRSPSIPPGLVTRAQGKKEERDLFVRGLRQSQDPSKRIRELSVHQGEELEGLSPERMLLLRRLLLAILLSSTVAPQLLVLSTMRGGAEGNALPSDFMAEIPAPAQSRPLSSSYDDLTEPLMEAIKAKNRQLEELAKKRLQGRRSPRPKEETEQEDQASLRTLEEQRGTLYSLERDLGYKSSQLGKEYDKAASNLEWEKWNLEKEASWLDGEEKEKKEREIREIEEKRKALDARKAEIEKRIAWAYAQARYLRQRAESSGSPDYWMDNEIRGLDYEKRAIDSEIWALGK